MATMSIIYTKEGAFRPVFMLSMLRLNDIENDWYSVFIIVSNKTLISISSVSSHNSISFHRAFSRFMIWDNDPRARLKWELFTLIILICIMNHFIYIQCCERLDLCLGSSRGINLLSNIHILRVLLEKLFEILFIHHILLRFASLTIWISTWVGVNCRILMIRVDITKRWLVWRDISSLTRLMPLLIRTSN